MSAFSCPNPSFPKLRDPITVMAVSVFLNVAGFTLIDPVVPFLVGEYVPRPELALYVGLIVSAYAVCEFVAAPLLGSLSDRFGRKPVLVASLLGSTIGYLVFGIGGALWVLFLGRIIDGLSAGSVSAMYACVADVTPSEHRGRVYGMLGAVGGAGFMIGPVIGGVLGEYSPSAPLFAAAALTALNILWVAIAVPETLPVGKRTRPQRWRDLNPVSQLSFAFGFPQLRFILVPAFLFCLAGAMMQSNISVFLNAVLEFGPLGIGFVLFAVGALDIIAQGLLTGRLIPRLGEARTAQIGLALNVAGFAGLASLALRPSIPLLIGAIAAFTLGDGLFQPSSSALIANGAPDEMQGRIQGANQGQQSIGRMIGPLLAAGFAGFNAAAPYWVGAGLVAAALMAMILAKQGDDIRLNSEP